MSEEPKLSGATLVLGVLEGTHIIEKLINLEKLINTPCPRCLGYGEDPSVANMNCLHCKGTGKLFNGIIEERITR